MTTEDELAKILVALRDAGFAMAGGPWGWPPAAVFEDLRSKGKVAGDFTQISWRSPEHPVLMRK